MFIYISLSYVLQENQNLMRNCVVRVAPEQWDLETTKTIHQDSLSGTLVLLLVHSFWCFSNLCPRMTFFNTWVQRSLLKVFETMETLPRKYINALVWHTILQIHEFLITKMYVVICYYKYCKSKIPFFKLRGPPKFNSFKPAKSGLAPIDTLWWFIEKIKNRKELEMGKFSLEFVKMVLF